MSYIYKECLLFFKLPNFQAVTEIRNWRTQKKIIAEMPTIPLCYIMIVAYFIFHEPSVYQKPLRESLTMLSILVYQSLCIERTLLYTLVSSKV